MTSTQVPIKDKVALITGANRGIGKAIVLELLERDALKVYAGARNIDSLKELQEQYGDKLIPLQLDVTDDSSIASAVEAAVDTDILINNAGVFVPGNFTQGDLQEGLQKNLEVNLYGPAKLTEGLLPALQQKDLAAIVSVSSVAGLACMPMALAYSVSKAALHSMVQGLRGELRGSNILVAGVYPGPIDTDMTKDFDLEKDTPENVAKHVIQGIEAGVEDIFPDVVAKQMGEAYMKAPKVVEIQMGS